MPKHLVVDLETLSLEPNAAIVAIGACIVGEPAATFHARILLASAVDDFGGHVSGSTLAWWLSQGDDARKELSGHRSLKLVLRDLGQWAIQNGWNADCEGRLWCKGPQEDLTWLSFAQKATGDDTLTWSHWQPRDVRTCIELCPEAEKIPFEGEKHNALADAQHQAKQVEMALRKAGVL